MRRKSLNPLRVREIARKDSHSLRQLVFAFVLSKSHEIDKRRILSANSHLDALNC